MQDFTTDWAAVEAHVTNYCRRRLGRTQSADEVVQDVRIRAWRGYASFQRRSSFLTWSLTIARREVNRHLGRRQPFVSIDSVPEPAAPPPPEAEASSKPGGLLGRIAGAVAAKALTEKKAVVLRARLADPEASWQQIGVAIGMTAVNCAVLNMRGVQDLRVYLFRCHDPLAGGLEGIRRAYATALAVEPREDRLSPREAAAFRRCVFDNPRVAPTRAELNDLRGAATKVARYLPRGGSI